MSEQKAFLEKVHIKNYRSLRNVTIPLKPLTVLVGPNASGKSNFLSALYSLKSMMTDEKLPEVESIQDSLWAGKAGHITFQLVRNSSIPSVLRVYQSRSVFYFYVIGPGSAQKYSISRSFGVNAKQWRNRYAKRESLEFAIGL